MGVGVVFGDGACPPTPLLDLGYRRTRYTVQLNPDRLTLVHYRSIGLIHCMHCESIKLKLLRLITTVYCSDQHSFIYSFITVFWLSRSFSTFLAL